MVPLLLSVWTLYIGLEIELICSLPRTSPPIGDTTALSRHAAWLKQMYTLPQLSTTAGAQSGAGPQVLSRCGGRLNILFILCASGCWNAVGGPVRKITVSTTSGRGPLDHPPSVKPHSSHSSVLPCFFHAELAISHRHLQESLPFAGRAHTAPKQQTPAP